ncbi:hypothetical protein N7462_005336 [Penicillium macrosclerotiorum]|uniref:uncharacterized protein n=1 Tax=Penicillium macrosclerotiorum TaxID=303699 RepID=UPI0025483E32|nr:uncharacterized protein N7462_005336 [Penicillium macrosclerotiorum]KAJ5682171.1 hypothetical protein N7462_005336 [Penicillium macrosclerotiorum]
MAIPDDRDAMVIAPQPESIASYKPFGDDVNRTVEKILLEEASLDERREGDWHLHSGDTTGVSTGHNSRSGSEWKSPISPGPRQSVPVKKKRSVATRNITVVDLVRDDESAITDTMNDGYNKDHSANEGAIEDEIHAEEAPLTDDFCRGHAQRTIEGQSELITEDLIFSTVPTAERYRVLRFIATHPFMLNPVQTFPRSARRLFYKELRREARSVGMRNSAVDKLIQHVWRIYLDGIESVYQLSADVLDAEDCPFGEEFAGKIDNHVGQPNKRKRSHHHSSCSTFKKRRAKRHPDDFPLAIETTNLVSDVRDQLSDFVFCGKALDSPSNGDGHQQSGILQMPSTPETHCGPSIVSPSVESSLENENHAKSTPILHETISLSRRRTKNPEEIPSIHVGKSRAQINSEEIPINSPNHQGPQDPLNDLTQEKALFENPLLPIDLSPVGLTRKQKNRRKQRKLHHHNHKKSSRSRHTRHHVQMSLDHPMELPSRDMTPTPSTVWPMGDEGSEPLSLPKHKSHGKKGRSKGTERREDKSSPKQKEDDAGQDILANATWEAQPPEYKDQQISDLPVKSAMGHNLSRERKKHKSNQSSSQRSGRPMNDFEKHRVPHDQSGDQGSQSYSSKYHPTQVPPGLETPRENTPASTLSCFTTPMSRTSTKSRYGPLSPDPAEWEMDF